MNLGPLKHVNFMCDSSQRQRVQIHAQPLDNLPIWKPSCYPQAAHTG